MVIDARGMGCPKPVLMAQDALSGLTEGIVEILVDNEGSSGNIVMYARKNGFFAESAREGKDWRVKIVKGYVCGATAEKTVQEQAGPAAGKGVFMVVAADSLGRDEELGRVLMKGFLETMKVTREIPRTMFFLNAGVKLTTVNGETVQLLKDIEAMGVEIYSCGTCLKYYGLETELKVGFRGTTSNIFEGIFAEGGKTVWIG